MSVSLPPVQSFQQPQSGSGDAPIGTAQLVEVPERLADLPRTITLSGYVTALEAELTRVRVSAGDILLRPSVPLLKGKPLLLQIAPGKPPTFAAIYGISKVGASGDLPISPPPPPAPKPEEPAGSGQTTPGTPSFAAAGLGALLEIQENAPPAAPRKPAAQQPEAPGGNAKINLDT